MRMEAEDELEETEHAACQTTSSRAGAQIRSGGDDRSLQSITVFIDVSLLLLKLNDTSACQTSALCLFFTVSL